MSTVTVPGSPGEALGMLESAARFLADADAAQMPAGALAECLRALERADVVQAAARVRFLMAFDAKDGHLADGQRNTRTWLVQCLRATRGQAGPDSPSGPAGPGTPASPQGPAGTAAGDGTGPQDSVGPRWSFAQAQRLSWLSLDPQLSHDRPGPLLASTLARMCRNGFGRAFDDKVPGSRASATSGTGSSPSTTGAPRTITPSSCCPWPTRYPGDKTRSSPRS